MNRLRVGLIAPSHWHFPMYRDGLLRSGAEFVGVSDPTPSIADRIAREFSCNSWADPARMLDESQPDFVFAFGVHAEMPRIAELLIERDIPFSIEKPCGTRAADVTRIRKLTETSGLFVSVPFHYRISSMAQDLSSIVTLPSADFLNFAIRVNAGSPLRYAESSPWLTSKALSGGGCLMNLGHHAIDFVLQATGSEPAEISAVASSKMLGLDIEDQAVLQIKLDDGTVATIDTGYTYASSQDSYMEFDLSVSHRSFSAQRNADDLIVRYRRDGIVQTLNTNWTFKTYFAHYAEQTLQRFVSAQRPIAGLRDLEVTMQVLDAAYRSIAEGAMVRMDSTQHFIQ